MPAISCGTISSRLGLWWGSGACGKELKVAVERGMVNECGDHWEPRFVVGWSRIGPTDPSRQDRLCSASTYSNASKGPNLATLRRNCSFVHPVGLMRGDWTTMVSTLAVCSGKPTRQPDGPGQAISGRLPGTSVLTRSGRVVSGASKAWLRRFRAWGTGAGRSLAAFSPVKHIRSRGPRADPVYLCR